MLLPNDETSTNTNSEETPLTSPPKRKALSQAAAKSGYLVLVSTVNISSEVFRVYLLAQLGIETLAASTFIYAITKVFIDPFLILTNQNAVFISQEYGKIHHLKNSSHSDDEDPRSRAIYENIGYIIRQGWYLNCFLSIPCGILLLLSNPLLQNLGVKEEITSILSEYFLPVIFSLPFILCSNINERFFLL